MLYEANQKRCNFPTDNYCCTKIIKKLKKTRLNSKLYPAANEITSFLHGILNGTSVKSG
jgi:hypothetical protein